MRRRQQVTADGLPVPPSELRTCFVEDWVRPGEEQPSWSLPDTWEEWARLAARQRWTRARREWAEAHGLTRKQWGELLPGGRPRWRGVPGSPKPVHRASW